MGWGGKNLKCTPSAREAKKVTKKDAAAVDLTGRHQRLGPSVFINHNAACRAKRRALHCSDVGRQALSCLTRIYLDAVATTAMLMKQAKPLATAAFLTISAISLVLWSSGRAQWSGFKTTHWTESLNTTTEEDVLILGDAHRLPTADDFWPHFYNVTRMRPVTMAEAKAGCHWLDIDKVPFNFGVESFIGVNLTWVLHEAQDQDLVVPRKEWQHFVNHEMLPYDDYASRFEGRGIVISGGYGSSTQRIKVILRRLNQLNSSLPVEIHYWKDEMSVETQQELLTIRPNIYYTDLSAPSNIIESNYYPKYKINFHFKINALLNSRFSELLLLDTDNVPVIDPERLFDSLEYKEHGSVFWPDITRTRVNNPIWPLTNTVCQMREWEQESGQVLVDKRKFWYHLQLSSWMITGDRGFYYNSFILGDKDMFRFAWHALKTRYGRPKKWVASVGYQVDNYYCGHSFGQYHPDNGEIAFLHGGTLKTLANEVIDWQHSTNGGIFQVYKAEMHDVEHGINVYPTIKWDGAAYLPNKPENLKIGMCVDMEELEARPLEQLVPDFDAAFEQAGGYWMVDSRGYEIGSKWTPNDENDIAG